MFAAFCTTGYTKQLVCYYAKAMFNFKSGSARYVVHFCYLY